MSEVVSRDFMFLNGAAGLDIPIARLEELEEGKWSTTDSSIDDYSARANFLGRSDGLVEIIRRQLGDADDNVGLDIAAGANGRALRDLLDSGILRKALITNFADKRSDEVKHNDRLYHITGNLVLPQTWHEILDWQETFAPDGLSLIMHRPVGALQDLPNATYRGALHLLLDRTRLGGLLFTQIPRPLVRDTAALLNIRDTLRARSDVGRVIVRSTIRKDKPHRTDTHVVIIKKAQTTPLT
jgi:hypothetical protein